MFNDLLNKINYKNQYKKDIKDFIVKKFFPPPKFEIINKHL